MRAHVTPRSLTTMARLPCTIHQLWQGAGMLCTLLLDTVRFLRLSLHSLAALAADNLLLRKPCRLLGVLRSAPWWLSLIL